MQFIGTTLPARAGMFLRLALDLVFPRHCLGCGGGVEDPAYRFVCASCRGNLHYIDAPYCRACGYPYFGSVMGERTCPNCREIKPSFSRGRALFLHRGLGGQLVVELKYHRGTFLRPDLLRLIRRFGDLEAYIGGAVLVPVPLHLRKERERGFNQSLFLAHLFAELSEGASVDNTLDRVRDTPSQTRLRRDVRQANVKNAFAIRPNARIQKDLDYIVVDDVYTTGSTLNACSNVLLAAGARDVRVLTLAHG